MRKILIVDDDSINCLLAKHALAKEYQTEAVNSGMAALAYLEKELPDLILMDIEMPEMDGKEVVRRIKANSAWAQIPVVFLTADSSPITEADCLQCGADDFITKPFVADVMKSRVARILETQAIRKDLEQELEEKTMKSFTDALTGLGNRDYLEQELEKLLNSGHGGTLFMTDLDNFKSMNDTYGHMVGDEVLKRFAETLKHFSSEKDILCRLGGDEFVAFFTDVTKKEEAAGKAAGIIKLFSDKMGAMGYGGIVSVSIGAKITDGTDSFEKLYEDADETLYFVKENGKNAYHFWTEGEVSALESVDTEAELGDIHRMILDSQGEQIGAFHVEYEEFKIIYDFALRSVNRNHQMVQTILFTLAVNPDLQSSVNMEQMMEYLKNAVVSSLRSVDTGTKYSNSQYIVLLMDADMENGKNVANRVLEKFRNEAEVASCGIQITYDIQPLRLA